jgi:hypothetical protein
MNRIGGLILMGAYLFSSTLAADPASENIYRCGKKYQNFPCSKQDTKGAVESLPVVSFYRSAKGEKAVGETPRARYNWSEPDQSRRLAEVERPRQGPSISKRDLPELASEAREMRKLVLGRAPGIALDRARGMIFRLRANLNIECNSKFMADDESALAVCTQALHDLAQAEKALPREYG